MDGLWHCFLVIKKIKAERSKWFCCKTSWFLFFLVKSLKRLCKYYSRLVWLPGKIMPFNHSASNCVKWLLIICSKSAKVMSKQCLGTIITSLFFSNKDFQSHSFGWKKDFLKFFLISLFNKWKIWWMLSQWKIHCPTKFLVTRLFLFLPNMFKLQVIFFVYLTNHVTNICTKLYTFCILPVQSQDHNIKSTLHKALFYWYCVALYSWERVKNLMRTLAWANFKSI